MFSASSQTTDIGEHPNSIRRKKLFSNATYASTKNLFQCNVYSETNNFRKLAGFLSFKKEIVLNLTNFLN